VKNNADATGYCRVPKKWPVSETEFGRYLVATRDPTSRFSLKQRRRIAEGFNPKVPPRRGDKDMSEESPVFHTS
jgi:hypothetical protein